MWNDHCRCYIHSDKYGGVHIRMLFLKLLWHGERTTYSIYPTSCTNCRQVNHSRHLTWSLSLLMLFHSSIYYCLYIFTPRFWRKVNMKKNLALATRQLTFVLTHDRNLFRSNPLHSLVLMWKCGWCVREKKTEYRKWR